METNLIPSVINDKYNDKIYNKTHLWISNNCLHINQNGEYKNFDLTTIESAQLRKLKSSLYKIFIVSTTLLFATSYVFYFNWAVVALHLITYSYSFLYLTQYKYYFIVLTKDNYYKFKIKQNDKDVYKTFLKDFNTKFTDPKTK
jgi:hypothetical protein